MSNQVRAKSKKYDLATLQLAVGAVRAKTISLRSASRLYSIPRATLFDKVNSKTPMQPVPNTVLSATEEQRLVEWAQHMAKIGFGRTRPEIKDTVKRIVEADGRQNPFKDNRPGKDWWYGFVNRHHELVERMPQQLGKERAIVSPEKVTQWFADYKEFIVGEVKDPTLLLDPSRLYNADESGFSLCPKSGKVMAKKGVSNVYHVTASDKTQITVLACMGATGHYLKPLIVYPGQRFSYNPLDGFTDAVMGRTDNGWMDSELFCTWLQDVFIPAINEKGIRKPVVLFVDGHSTHMSLNVSDICRQNQIELYCLLEHASHLIQPCDLSLFASLKENWKQSVRNYQFENIGDNVTKKSFANVFKGAWEKSTTVSVAVNGFREAGLFPLNPAKVLNTVKMAPSVIFRSNTNEIVPDVADVPACTLDGVTCEVEVDADVTDAAGSVAEVLIDVAYVVPDTMDSVDDVLDVVPDVAEFVTISSNNDDVITNSSSTAPATDNDILTCDLPVHVSGPCVTPSVEPCPSGAAGDTPYSAIPRIHSYAATPNDTAADMLPGPIPVVRPHLSPPFQHSPSVASTDIQSSATPSISPAVLSVLQFPLVKVPQNSRAKRQTMPKAITGEKFRQLLQDKRKEKENIEAAKLERKMSREKKKIENDLQKKRKREEQERKKKERDELKKRKIEVKKTVKKIEKMWEQKYKGNSSSEDDDELPQQAHNVVTTLKHS